VIDEYNAPTKANALIARGVQPVPEMVEEAQTTIEED
jgi:hypothetical protein